MSDPTTLPPAPNGNVPSEFEDWSIGALEGALNNDVTLQVSSNPCRINVRLRRYRRGRPHRHVLLVHGASAGSRTFLVPEGGLVRYLVGQGFDVWTLDWRGSNLFKAFNVVPTPSGPMGLGLSPYAQRFDLDIAAREDLLQSLQAIGTWLARETASEHPIAISVLGHCVGGALVTQAIAMQLFEGARSESMFCLGPTVVTTLGLFYRVGPEGWLKGNEYLLEQLSTQTAGFENPHHPVVNPNVAYAPRKWPEPLEAAFQLWVKSPFTPKVATDQRVAEFVQRIGFMYGMPYSKHQLPGIEQSGALELQFGDMPLKLYMHCVRNLRTGFAVPFRGNLRQYVNPKSFVSGSGEPLTSLTFITGSENQVWHRDSIDRTHEWLLNQTSPSSHGRLVKHVLPGYAHQDLYWSPSARSEVYPLIVAGLERS